jgi:hypothetical protein
VVFPAVLSYVSVKAPCAIWRTSPSPGAPAGFQLAAPLQVLVLPTQVRFTAEASFVANEPTAAAAASAQRASERFRFEW